MSSTSPKIGEYVRRAQTALNRREPGALTFRSVRHAVNWYYEARQRMASPVNMHPRGEINAAGDAVIVSVDGGRGGDLHEVLVTLEDIHRGLERLREDLPTCFEVLDGNARGVSMKKLGEDTGRAAATISAEIGRAEGYLLAVFRAGGIVR